MILPSGQVATVVVSSLPPLSFPCQRITGLPLKFRIPRTTKGPAAFVPLDPS